MHPSQVWAASDYGPTARRLAPIAEVVAERAAQLAPAGARVADIGAGHGAVTARLVGRGFDVVALEPTERMRIVGAERVAAAKWVDALGERTGLPGASVDGIASSFGAIFCDPEDGPREWARILRPGGSLVMTAWDGHGFLAEMTARMFAVTSPGQESPPHMGWGDDAWARERLAPHFADVTIEHREVPWTFPSVEAGMDLYLHGSPSHAFSLNTADEKRPALLAALEQHLRDHERDGRIDAVAGYSLITARH